MKKLIRAFSAAACLIAVLYLCTGVKTAASDDITVELDGKEIEFDVSPQIIDGRTMVPLRKIFEEIGANVKWDSDTQTVSARKSSKTVTLSINSNELTVDTGKTNDSGNSDVQTVTLDVPAQIVSGRTLVPARAISECFGLDVDWNAKSQKVIITSDSDDDDSWKENVGSINMDKMSCDGDGVEIDGNQINISSGGDFTVTGTLENGSITINTKEKVKLRLSGAKITSKNNPCIYVENTKKAYITLTEGTNNYLTAANAQSGAIYSKDNLEIKGAGNLEIVSENGHGIKASDNLSIENGSITINAESDGIHINDTFKMAGGTLDITAVGDGIDSESIVNITGGTVNIETNGTPVSTAQSESQTAGETPRRGMREEESGVEFEKSTKGINAEWMMCISGGKININSASHSIHCKDEIEINGGKFTLSSEYGKGMSAHGNLTVNVSDTTIDITKSTEGIESKNVLTINDGNINVVSTDDALNATGGNSGEMMPGGGFGGGEFAPPEGFDKDRENGDTSQQPGNPGDGMPPNGEPPEKPDMSEMPEMPDMPQNRSDTENPPQRPQQDGITNSRPGGNPGGENGNNMKDCLIINGGHIELCGGDDCIDSNGNLIINGGTIKAVNSTGSFAGPFAVIDPGGQTVISDKATLIFASEKGEEKQLDIEQNTIIVYCTSKHNAGEKISVSDSNGKVVYEYTPKGSFESVMIASPKIKTGENYTIKIGSETFSAAVSDQTIVVGTRTSSKMNRNFSSRKNQTSDARF